MKYRGQYLSLASALLLLSGGIGLLLSLPSHTSHWTGRQDSSKFRSDRVSAALSNITSCHVLLRGADGLPITHSFNVVQDSGITPDITTISIWSYKLFTIAMQPTISQTDTFFHPVFPSCAPANSRIHKPDYTYLSQLTSSSVRNQSVIMLRFPLVLRGGMMLQSPPFLLFSSQPKDKQSDKFVSQQTLLTENSDHYHSCHPSKTEISDKKMTVSAVSDPQPATKLYFPLILREGMALWSSPFLPSRNLNDNQKSEVAS